MTSEITPDMVRKATREIDTAIRTVRDSQPVEPWWESWKVEVPEYDADGVVVKRFEITPEQAAFDQLRAALNPQRPNRATQPGTYTNLTVDGTLWMTDTPAEVVDLFGVDTAMRDSVGGSMLIVGLGLGLVLHRAITHRDIGWIDVVEREGRVIDAVADHYYSLAAEHEVGLRIHQADIHEWKPPPLAYWDLGWFDIWADIDMDDRAEVKKLRDRYRRRLGWFGAWAQWERNQQARRIRTKRGFY